MFPQLVRSAREVPLSSAPIEDWATEWASESVRDAASAYDGVTFSKVARSKWQASFADRPAYLRNERRIQKARIVEAGARLAAIFEAIWP
jgi:hypothetical protein